MFKYVVHFMTVLCVSFTVITCSDKTESPPRQKQVNPTPVKSDDTEKTPPVVNELPPTIITESEINEYRQKLSNFSPDELIDALRADVSEIRDTVKVLGTQLADNKLEEAKRSATVLNNRMRKSHILAQVTRLRMATGEFSQEQASTLMDVQSEMIELLDASESVVEIADEMIK